MKTIKDLNQQELLIYSEVLVSLTETLIKHDDFTLRLTEQFEGIKIVQFPLMLPRGHVFPVCFNKEERQFYYRDTLIPKGIFDHIIDYV